MIHKRVVGNLALAVFVSSLGLGSLSAAEDGAEIQERPNVHEGKPTSYWRDHVLATHYSPCNPPLTSPLRSGPAAVPVLLQLLKDSDQRVRIAALSCLASIQDISAVPAMTNALEDASWQVRCEAASALGTIGPKAKAALPAINHRLRDSNVFVRSEAVAALWRMGGDSQELLPDLVKVLAVADGQDGPVDCGGIPCFDFSRARLNAAMVLVEIGPRAVEIVPRLADLLLKSPDQNLRPVLVYTLASMGPAGKEGIPAICQTLSSAKNARVRQSAAKAIGDIGVPSELAIRSLQSALRDDDQSVRESAAQSLEALTKPMQK